MEFLVTATVEVQEIINEINKLKAPHRMSCLMDILNQIEWYGVKEKEALSAEDKATLQRWMKRKLEWIDLMLFKCGGEIMKEWEVIIADGGDDEDPKECSGYDHGHAATIFVDQNFADLDYPEEVEILVRKVGETSWKQFNVTAEMVPSFSAVEICPED